MKRFAALLIACAITSVAHADALSRAREHLRELDVPAARQQLARAMATRLTADQLAFALETRALLEHVDGNLDAMTTALSQLAAFRPRYQFGSDAPPEVTLEFEAHASTGPLILLVESTEQPLGARVRATVENDPGRIVRELVVHVHAGETWTAHRSAGRAIQLTTPPGARYYVEALGPGGARVGMEGNAPETRSRPSTSRWGVGIGAGAGAILAIVAGVLIARRPSRTRVNAPWVRAE